MAKWDRVKAGDVLHEVTTTRSWAGKSRDSWPVRVIEVNHSEGWAVVSWNGNKPSKVHNPVRYFAKLQWTMPGERRRKP